jgi:hypothetical protein
MTPAVLKQRVLDELGVVAEGAPYPADDVKKVGDKYAGIHAQLLARGLVTWGIAEEIPDAIQNPIIWIVAFSCANVFGIPPSRYTFLATLGALDSEPMSLGEKQLRRSMYGRAIPSTLASSYF